MQEANKVTIHAVLHTAYDRDGVNGGYGGGDPSAYNGPRDFTSSEYGPGGSCIDTNSPFRVAASFPVDENGLLAHMKVTYTQSGCTLSTTKIGEGQYENADWNELSSVLMGGVSGCIFCNSKTHACALIPTSFMPCHRPCLHPCLPSSKNRSHQ